MSYRPVITILKDRIPAYVGYYKNWDDKELLLVCMAMSVYFDGCTDADEIRRKFKRPTSDQADFENDLEICRDLIICAEQLFIVDLTERMISCDSHRISFDKIDRKLVYETDYYKQLKDI